MSAASLSPQALAEACAKAMWDDDNATRHLGMELVSVAPGEAVIAMTVAETMTNGHGTCHGGSDQGWGNFEFKLGHGHLTSAICPQRS